LTFEAEKRSVDLGGLGEQRELLSEKILLEPGKQLRAKIKNIP
jgi:hypothetical protein